MYRCYYNILATIFLPSQLNGVITRANYDIFRWSSLAYNDKKKTKKTKVKHNILYDQNVAN